MRQSNSINVFIETPLKAEIEFKQKIQVHSLNLDFLVKAF